LPKHAIPTPLHPESGTAGKRCHARQKEVNSYFA
jgi:hypothetical protein